MSVAEAECVGILVICGERRIYISRGRGKQADGFELWSCEYKVGIVWSVRSWISYEGDMEPDL